MLGNRTTTCRGERTTLALLLFSCCCAVSAAVKFHVVVRDNKTDQVKTVRILSDDSSRSVRLEQFDNRLGVHHQWSVVEEQGLQIFRTTILGELDRLEPAAYQMCFITSTKGSRLIQFNVIQSLVQDDASVEHRAHTLLDDSVHVIDLQVRHGNMSAFGMSVGTSCVGVHAIYSSARDVKLLAKGNAQLEETMMNSTIVLPTHDDMSYPSCKEASSQWTYGCFCQQTICHDWFPCETQFCSSIDELGSDVSYVCGIKPCRQCRVFQFFISSKEMCFWNLHQTNS